MKFAIITHVVHKKINNNYYAYEPYVREMNLWIKNISNTLIVAPISNENITEIDSSYIEKMLILIK